MILTLHFLNMKKIQLSLSAEKVMEFVEGYTNQECYVMAFVGTDEEIIYVPLHNVNYFEVKDVSEELPESSRAARRSDPGSGVQSES